MAIARGSVRGDPEPSATVPSSSAALRGQSVPGLSGMTIRGLDARAAEQEGVIAFMEQHGRTLMIVELVVLAILTFAAIGTDDYWMRGTEKKEGNENVG